MSAELRLAYSSPTSIHTHLSLVAGRGIVVSVRAASGSCRARLIAAPGASGGPSLRLVGLHQTTLQPGPVLVSYRHASVEYRFHSQLGPRSPDDEAPLQLPRRILRRDQRLDRRVDCSRRDGFHALLRWSQAEAEAEAGGQVLDLSAHGLRVGGLASAPPVDTWVELVPTLAGVVGACRPALVRHRAGPPGDVVLGLQLTGQGFRDDSDLHAVLRSLLQAPLGPSRSLH